MAISRRHDERGSVTLWTVFITIAVLMLGGLVIDGGYAMSAKREAARTAEQAARAGADQLDTDSVRSGGDDVAPGAASAAAHQYLRAVGESGSVIVVGDQVIVTVTKRQPSHILEAFGRGDFVMSSTARARSIDDGP